MSTAVINIKTDTKTKEQAQKIAEELGFSLSSLISASLKQIIRDKRINFSLEQEITPWLEARIENVERDLKNGNNIRKFKTKKDFFEDLNK